MSVLPWTDLSATTAYQTNVFSLRRVRRRAESDGREADFHVIECPDWVNIIALTGRPMADDGGSPPTSLGNVVLVRQFRHGVRQITAEIPGGMVDGGETHLEAAVRELREETGYEAGVWRKLGAVEPNPAIQSNRLTTFLAAGARRIGPPTLDANEEIEVFERPLSAVPGMLRDGALSHALVVVAFALLASNGLMEMGLGHNAL